jgi:hypothetical protein
LRTKRAYRAIFGIAVIFYFLLIVNIRVGGFKARRKLILVM